MTRSASIEAAPIVLIGAAVALGLLAFTPVSASPDGAEWETADDPEGCLSCHLGATVPVDADSLSIEGLPGRPEAGRRYALTIVLEDPAIQNAGFLLSVEADGEPAGRLDSIDEKTETNGARARSTWDGSKPVQPGKASWELEWTAPAAIEGPIRFDLWGNTGNDDLSPLGDQPHHRTWQLPAEP